MDTELDFTFPKYNPNPEDMHMLHAMGEAVKAHGADLCLVLTATATVAACGRYGARNLRRQDRVMLARDLSAQYKNRNSWSM